MIRLFILFFFNQRLIREWEQEMNDRPDHVKRSKQGKLTAAIQKQTDEYMQPFFRNLKKKVKIIIDLKRFVFLEIIYLYRKNIFFYLFIYIVNRTRRIGPGDGNHALYAKT